MDYDKRKINIVLFDIGGVLIEYEDVFKTVITDLKLDKDYIGQTFEKYDSQITTGIITPHELYLLAKNEYKLDIPEDYDFFKSWLNDYKVIKPTFEFVNQLSNVFKLGLLSNIYKGMVDVMINAGQLPDVKYSYKFISADIGLQKPDIQIYKFVEETTKLTGSQIFYIDDRDDYLAEPQKMGWQCFKFPRKEPENGIKLLKEILL